MSFILDIFVHEITSVQCLEDESSRGIKPSKSATDHSFHLVPKLTTRPYTSSISVQAQGRVAINMRVPEPDIFCYLLGSQDREPY